MRFQNDVFGEWCLNCGFGVWYVPLALSPPVETLQIVS
jgi:hypothetical protein